MRFTTEDGTIIEVLDGTEGVTGSEPVGRMANAVNRAASSFEAGIQVLGAVARTVSSEMRRVEDAPSCLTIEFGLTATSSGDLALVSAEAAAIMTVRMTWSERHDAEG
jgi:hypothetical protein